MEDNIDANVELHLSCGALLLDLHSLGVRVLDQLISISLLEYKVLVYLARNQERPVPAEELLEAVWKCTDGGTANQVMCCFKRLRKKLAVNGAPQYLHVQRGFGFRLCEPDKLPPRKGGKAG